MANQTHKNEKVSQLLLCSFIGLTYTWSPLYGVAESLIFPQLGSQPDVIFTAHIINLLAFSLSCVLFARVRTVGTPRLQMLVSGSFYLLGMLLGILCGMGFLPAPALYLSAALRGFFFMFIIVCWLKILSLHSGSEVGVSVSLGLALYAATGIFIVFVASFNTALSAMLLFACPLLACAIYLYLCKTECPAPQEEERATQPEEKRFALIRMKLYAANLTYGVTFGALLYCFTQFSTIQSMSVFLAMSVVGALTIWTLRKRVNLSGLLSAAIIATTIISVPAVIFESQLPQLSLMVASAVLAILLVYTTVIFMDSEMDTTGNDWHVLGSCLALAGVGFMVSSALIYCVGISSINNSAVLLFAIAGICFVGAVFAPKPGIQASDWGFSNMLLPESPEVVRMRRCGVMATQFDLTPRELEVLQLLATGADKTRIAQALYISPATAKTHAHNVYVKLGVHNARELDQLIEYKKEAE